MSTPTLSPHALAELLQEMTLAASFRALVILLVGIFVSRWVSQAIFKATSRFASPQQALLLRRAVWYLLLLLFFVAAIQQLGFQLSVLLGALSVLTLAVGFASQTSISNIISGLFLIVEQPFVIGDSVTVGDVQGEVLSIDLLSIKLRKADNALIRIPNETLIKTTIINSTRFPIRRFDLALGIAYKEDIDKVRRVLLQVAQDNPICLETPGPLVLLTGFGENAVNIQFSVWCDKNKFLDLKNTIQEAVKRAFDQEKIEIPFPQRVVYTQSG